jgi:2-polyprenyl-6-methoxyphenol hydroxylase-like FAD-dependent oxidoreductase
MNPPQVLIVGAGPTGLVLALWLTRLGVRVRIVDKLAEPGTTSRALVVHARTLELYQQVDLADAVVSSGLKFMAANLWAKGRIAGRVGFGRMGEGLSPFPYALIYPQDAHERLLIQRLAQEGIAVERPVELVDFTDEGDRIAARLRHPDGRVDVCHADYIAGCDGAHSTVRQSLDIDFPGGTYSHMFYVADVAASGPVMNGELNVALDEADFVAVFPLDAGQHARLIGIVRDDSLDKRDLAWADVSTTAIDRLGVRVQRVNWFSTYHVHHRVARRFHQGRAFLLGDAAHIHSPVGGQGMNTGIGDAVNLAWKLAAVALGQGDPRLLETYEPERIAFARRLVATTDRAFTFISNTGPLARFVRVVLAPRLLPLLFRSATVRRFMFRTVSQIAINYRDSALSEGAVGKVHAGDRLPWVEGLPGKGDNYAPLRSLAWQLHVYGDCPPDVAEACRRHTLPLNVFAWTTQAARAGLRRGALYLVRPDAHLAFASPTPNVEHLQRYLDATGIHQESAGTH